MRLNIQNHSNLISRTLSKSEKMNVPKAPGLGLLLAQVFYCIIFSRLVFLNIIRDLPTGRLLIMKAMPRKLRYLKSLKYILPLQKKNFQITFS